MIATCPRCGWTGPVDQLVSVGIWPFNIECCPHCACEKVVKS